MSQLLELNRMFVRQKAKLIELTNEYAIMDEEGNQVGAIRQEGQSAARKVLRFVTSVDQFLTHRLGIYDAGGAKVLELRRPGKIFKSKIHVTDAAGQPVGSIIQENVFGKIRFGLVDPAGQRLGAVNAENWRAWDFHIADSSGAEIGRITKKWAGVGKELFTTADNYMVEISPSATGPLRSLAFAAAAGVDTALKQDARGLG
jgi:uncharacterized protein YxjI